MNSSICIIGCGGLGTTTAQYLAMTGIGRIHLIDFDKVEMSNLNRQLSFLEQDIGKNKAEVLKKNIEKINPDSVVTILKKKITSGNINSSIKNSKFVIDCSDNFKTRFLVNEYCFKEKKILVSLLFKTLTFKSLHSSHGQSKTHAMNAFFQDSLDLIF